MTATIRSGKTIRMPNTAIAMPHVMKRRRHTGSISRQHRRVHDGVVERQRDLEHREHRDDEHRRERAVAVPVISQPIKAPRPSPATVTRYELRK